MQFLGVQIDYPFVQTAVIQKTRKKIEVSALKKFLLSDVDDVKQLYSKDFKGKIASGISAKNILLRLLEVKISKDRYIDKAVAFQAEATTHFNLSEMIVLSGAKKKKQDATEVLLFTVPRETIKAHLFELEKLQIDPDGVSTIPTALCRFIHWKIPTLKEALIIDLGFSEWTCISMENGELKKSHSISGGIESLLIALWEDQKKILLRKEIEGTAKQLDLMILKPQANPYLTIKLNEFKNELAKTIFSLQRETQPKPILFTGRTDAFGHLPEFLADGIKEVSAPDFSSPLTLEEQKFAASIGLALEQAHSCALQFRISEFFPKKNWRRIGFYSLLLFSCSFLLALLLWFAANRSFQLRKDEISQSLLSSLDQWNPSLKKNLITGIYNEEEAIHAWTQEIEKNNKPYPYIPQAPKMAEVLSWISSHELLKQFESEGDAIDIRELHYELVQFPKIGASQEAYLGKVEIEFQFKEVLNARKFHDSLLKGDSLVNGDLEISWDVLNDSYRTSFFLKNRSAYVH